MVSSSALSGRVALVTGAASGIGLATARLLGSLGAVIHAADLVAFEPDGEPDADEGGSRWTTLALDVRSEASWEAATHAVLEERGRLDILVHAAGLSAARPLAETTLDDWRRVMSTNLDGTFLAIRQGIRAMGEEGGAIVVLGSASGIRPSAGAAAYSTSKAGVGMLVRAAARECRENGLPIRINAVSPAGVRTPLWESMDFFQDLVREHGSSEAAFAAMEAAGGGRFLAPEAVAQSVLHLVSDAAAHITGVELSVDDGYVL